MKPIISGIQQMGIGVKDVHKAWTWYRKNFGFDIPIFEEAAEANLMLLYTGGKPQSRHAVLAFNMQGGGGFEIWQYTSRTPVNADFEIQMGDLGIFITKIKTPNAAKALEFFKNKNEDTITEIVKSPDGKEHFFMKDPYGNIFELVEFDDWYKKKADKITGGVAGAIIGVTDIEKSKEFYAKILGYDIVVYEEEGVFDDFKGVIGGEGKFKRVLLRHSETRKGHFSQMLNSSEIELVQSLDRDIKKIYENRFWGDLGFIHLCYDITGMAEMKERCESLGHPFTVDSSNSFDMGEAAGHFTYIEDPDGTLIEFVETHKIPVMKKLGIYLNLRKRNPEKSLPRFIINSLQLMRKKD
ncbi:MAG: VOC family protein [Verrucomicrobiota bacterium]|nr:VOC family protein [Verrucomicrobiota bacterium]